MSLDNKYGNSNDENYGIGISQTRNNFNGFKGVKKNKYQTVSLCYWLCNIPFLPVFCLSKILSNQRLNNSGQVQKHTELLLTRQEIILMALRVLKKINIKPFRK